jgi:hypothetical protein
MNARIHTVVATSSGFLQCSILALLAVSSSGVPLDAAPDDAKESEARQRGFEAWKNLVEERIAAEPGLKALAVKYPVVHLCSVSFLDDHSGYSFILETADRGKHRHHVQLRFHNGGDPKSFDVNPMIHQNNLFIDLGKIDFEQDPDPKRFHPKDHWLRTRGIASEEHVYLVRIQDARGNHFHVLFQVLAMDRKSRYLSFVWRKLPGGQVNREPPPPLPVFDDQALLKAIEARDALRKANQPRLGKLLPEWRRAVEETMARDPVLKDLAGRYPLVLLHSRRFYGDEPQCDFSFISATPGGGYDHNRAQILFDNGGDPRQLVLNGIGDEVNLVLDLGRVDFTRDPDLTPHGLEARWMVYSFEAVAGHVYLLRYRDPRGNDFWVLFQVVAVDRDSNYLAFVWRRLPGGKVARDR